MVRLRVNDVTTGGRVASRANVMQQKTQRPVQFETTASTRQNIADWLAEGGLAGSRYLFPNASGSHLSTRQYARMLKSWISDIGLDAGAYRTHSIRRTKPSMIYRRTKNLRAVQLLLGHTKLESTVRYLGIDVEDALEIVKQTEV